MAELQFSRLDQLLPPGTLSPLNRQVLEYWLSIGKNGELPSRADFNPAKVRGALNRMCLFDVRPNESIVCRVAGSAIGSVLNRELSGQDFRSYTPKIQQGQRMTAFNMILSGLAMRNRRQGVTTAGRSAICDELVLPFGDVRENGTRQVLTVYDFAYPDYKEFVVRPQEVLGAPLSYQFFAP